MGRGPVGGSVVKWSKSLRTGGPHPNRLVEQGRGRQRRLQMQFVLHVSVKQTIGRCMLELLPSGGVPVLCDCMLVRAAG